MKKKTLLSWSSGKDSGWALHLLQQDPQVELLGLFTVMNQRYNRVSMHATRLEMLQRQASAVGLPLQTIHLPDPCTNEQCDSVMRHFVTESSAMGVECTAFGDLFLEGSIVPSSASMEWLTQAVPAGPEIHSRVVMLLKARAWKDLRLCAGHGTIWPSIIRNGFEKGCPSRSPFPHLREKEARSWHQ
jgi:hypothetical protein